MAVGIDSRIADVLAAEKPPGAAAGTCSAAFADVFAEPDKARRVHRLVISQFGDGPSVGGAPAGQQTVGLLVGAPSYHTGQPRDRFLAVVRPS
jgi:hypothetical protein